MKEMLVCQDCDREFDDDDAAELDDGARCMGCGKCVCGMGCSASNGEGRVCLECAMH